MMFDSSPFVLNAANLPRMPPSFLSLISEEVAIKLESVQSKHPQLQYESRLYRLLEGGGECHDVVSFRSAPCTGS